MFDEDEKTSTILATAAVPEVSRRSAYLFVLSGQKSVGKMFKLSGEMVIGRSGAADVVIDDDGVSRRHAKIVVRQDALVELVDLGSTNGTFCNGQRIGTQLLHDGDKIQVGSATILKFSYQDALDEAWQKNLYESATRDGLTRIYNRKYFTDAIEKEFAYARRHALPLSFLIFDIDHFKRINDTHGHAAGDHVLQRLAQTVTKCIRAEDIFARYGGEEFVLLLRELGQDKTILVAERIRRTVETTEFRYADKPIPVTISVGVASLQGGCETASELIEAADRCLYRAKQSGRNRVEADGTAPPRGSAG